MHTNRKILDMVYIGFFAALMALCSWIMVPSALPFTLQTMGVFLTMGLLGGRRGTLSVLTYILLGALGLPVFSGFTGGIGALLGATGGYIAGFLLSALVMWAMEVLFGTGRKVLALSMVLGLLTCYGFGSGWYLAVYAQGKGLWAVLLQCVVPFMIPDLIKIAVALFLTGRLRRFVK